MKTTDPKDPQDTSRIYALRHPETGLIRFIECTLYLLPEKMYRILAVARCGDSGLRSRWIRQLTARGLEPEMILLEEGGTQKDLGKWKREYEEELLDNVTRRKSRSERSANKGTP